MKIIRQTKYEIINPQGVCIADGLTMREVKSFANSVYGVTLLEALQKGYKLKRVK